MLFFLFFSPSLARSKIFIRVRLEKDFSFLGGWKVHPAENHQPVRPHASFELCFWMQVKYDNCEFHNFSNLLQKRFGARIVLRSFLSSPGEAFWRLSRSRVYCWVSEHCRKWAVVSLTLASSPILACVLPVMTCHFLFKTNISLGSCLNKEKLIMCYIFCLP